MRGKREAIVLGFKKRGRGNREGNVLLQLYFSSGGDSGFLDRERACLVSSRSFWILVILSASAGS